MAQGSYKNMKPLLHQNVLGINVTNASEEDILKYIGEVIRERSIKIFIVTPNPEIIIAAYRDKDFKTTLNNASISLCDGIGLYLGAKILGVSIRQRVTGTDMVTHLCELASRLNMSVGFLGGKEGVAEETAKCLVKLYPKLNVLLSNNEWEEKYNALKIDILFVAFGYPKQERWMEKHISSSNVAVMLGVGGAFDYISGRVERAPLLFRRVGLEWIYRLIRQPWRWQRQLALFNFVYLIFKEKLGRR